MPAINRCSEDYRWWWRSFLTSGSTALYVMLYSVAYFAHLEGNMVITYVLYFSYMGMISLAFFLLTGTKIILLLCACIPIYPSSML